jgi:hypothetical protein
MSDEIGDIYVVEAPRSGYAEDMFATKPPTPSREFDELARAFDRGTLAALFARDPDTVGRWRQAQRVPHTVEMVVDRFWWVMHVACAQHRWPVNDARYFLLSIDPRLERRPADLIRESEEQTRSVVQLIAAGVAPPRPAAHDSVPAQTVATESPFARLLADEPDDDDGFSRPYRAPSLAGRSRAIGGLREDIDPFVIRYTTRTSHAIPLGASAVGV